MTQLKVSILKMRCLRTTWEISADEIYYAMYFFKAKLNEEQQIEITKDAREIRVSEVQLNVSRDLEWIPKLNEQTFNLNDCDAFGLFILLGEKDNGEVHKKLKQFESLKSRYESLKSKEAEVNFKNIDFQRIWQDVPRNPLDWKAWIPFIIESLINVFQMIESDDCLPPIDVEPFGYALDDPRLEVGSTKTILFKGGFGKYEMELKLELIDKSPEVTITEQSK